MPRADLIITVPEDVWIGDLSHRYPDVVIRILAAFANGERGVGLVELSGSPVDSFIDDLESRDEVTELTVLSANENRTLVQFETSMPLLLFPIHGSGVPLELPFDLKNGEAQWEVTASRERLSRLGEQLDEFEIPYRVDSVKRHVETKKLLTDRQRQLLVTAVEEGYYDTPRECTLTELAETVDIAKSTCSETLHRAEEAVLKEYVSGINQSSRLVPDE